MSRIRCPLLLALIVAVPLGINLPLTTSLALAQTNQVTAQSIEADRTEQFAEANRLSQLGIQQFNNGQTQPALETFQQELELRRQLGDRTGEVRSLGWIGQIYQRLGQLLVARELFEEALIIAQEIGDRRDEGVHLNNIGSIYSRLGQYPQALDYHQRSLRVAQEIGDRRGEGESLNGIGFIYSSLGQYPQALDYYQRSLVIAQEIGDRISEAVQLNNIGFIYYSFGQYPQALNYFQRSLAMRQEIGDRSGEGLMFNNIGSIYDSLGQYPQALDYYQQSLAIAQEIGDRSGEGLMFNNIGSIYYSLGQYPQALDYFQRSLAIRQEIGDRRGEGELLNNIGSIYFSLGEYPQALDYFQRSLVIRQEIGDRSGEGLQLNNIGNIYSSFGEYPQALGYYQRSLAIAQEISDRSGEGLQLNNIGFIYSSLGEYPQALDYYQRSLAIRQEIGDRSGEGVSLNNIGSIYFSLGEYPQALDYFQRSLSIMQEIGDRETEGVTLANIGRLLDIQQQPEVAIVFLKQSVNVRESIREGLQPLPPELQQSYTNTVADDYRFLADLLLSQGRIIEAQQVLELLKLEELREFTRNARGLESEQGIALNSVEQSILEEFGTLVAFGKQVYDCEQSRCAQLSAYRQQRQAQSTRFDTQVTSFVQTIRDNRQNDDFFYDPRYLNETAREIVAEPGTLLIYPFVTEDQVWLLYTAAGDVAGAIPVDVTQLELGTTVVHFRELLESPYSNLEELQATGKQLYDWLIAPLEPELQANQITTLVFSQDRVTRYIPMVALWDGDRYLMQNYTLSTILSAELTDMSDRLPASPTDTRVLALGLSASVLDLDPLPYVENELDAVVRVNQADSQGIYPGMELLNGDFNRDALVANLFGHGVVHIATHGSFVAGRPEESFLVLGDGDRFSIPDINSIGSDLRDVHLVVLSACETAVGGPDADGIEVAGISSYFLAANRASAVMASLWLVNDCSTSLLMQQFYQNLSQGMSKAEALRQAQQALLASDARVEDCENRMFNVAPREGASPSQTAAVGYSHPYYWAPFILIGNGL